MSTDRIAGIHVFHCDECPDCYEGESGDSFNEVWGAAKAEGWVTFRTKKGFEHRCSRCAEKP